jgi:hypothetical protein
MRTLILLIILSVGLSSCASKKIKKETDEEMVMRILNQ